MSSDFERMFASLAEDAGRARLAPAETVRRRADRRLAAQAVVACVAVAVVVAGTAVGSRWMLAGGVGPAPAPAASTTPSPTAPSVSAPPSTPQSDRSSSTPPSQATRPTIPVRVFIGADGSDGESLEDVPKGEALPSLCGAKYASDTSVEVRRAQRSYYTDPDVANRLAGLIDQTVTVYRADGARAFMDELRAAVGRCPQQKVGDDTYRHRLIDPSPVGDESLLLQVTFPRRVGPEGTVMGTSDEFLSAVRIGDAVCLVYLQGWEGASVDKAEITDLTRQAAQRLEQWRR